MSEGKLAVSGRRGKRAAKLRQRKKNMPHRLISTKLLMANMVSRWNTLL
jgi:hypothetical protein